MIQRDDLRFQLLLLTRLFEDEPARELKPKCLILVDQVATYASHQHGGLPQSIAEILPKFMVSDWMVAAVKKEKPDLAGLRPYPRGVFKSWWWNTKRRQNSAVNGN